MLIQKEIWKYCYNLASEESDLLKALERETFLKTTDPEMISGKLQGRWLSFISRLKKPNRILEIGTFTGYATLCLAEGLSEHGIIQTIERDEEMIEIAQKYFNSSAYTDRIELLVGNALEVISKLEGTYDLVFMDAGKKEYIEYYDLLFPKLKSGSVILADNILWRAKVLEEKKDIRTERLNAFNLMVQNDDRVDNFILPIRDGIHIITVK